MDVLESQNRAFAGRNIVSEALLYLDDGAAEAIHTNLGSAGLADHASPMVFRLHDAQSSDAELYSFMHGCSAPRRLVIIVTQLLKDVHSLILRAIKVHPSVTSCLILSSVSEEAHGASLGEDAYLEYEQAVSEDLTEMFGKSGEDRALPSLDVGYLPLQACALTSTAFVLPAASAAACKARAAVRISADPPSQGQEGLGKEERAGMKLLAHALVGLAATLDCSLETFSLGPAARVCGEELCSLEAPEDGHRQPPKRRAAILLLDRRLDLCTPIRHSAHIVDRMFGLLPRPRAAPAVSAASPGPRLRPLEIAVPCARDGTNSARPLLDAMAEDTSLPPRSSLFPTTPLTSSAESSSNPWLQGQISLRYGTAIQCQRHVQDPAAAVQLLLARRDTDAVLFIRKWLKEAIRKAGLQPPRTRFKPGSVTAAELQGLVEVLGGGSASEAVQNGLLGVANAAVAALSCPGGERWDALAKLEQQLAMLSADGPEGLILELEDVLRTARGKRLLGVGDALQLVVQAYSLAADQARGRGLGMGSPTPVFSAPQVQQLRGGLVDAILSADVQHGEDWLGGLGTRLRWEREQGAGRADSSEEYTDKALRLEVEDKVDDLLAKLGNVGMLRQTLSPHLAASPAADDGSQPLIQSVTAAIAGRQQIPGLQHHSASLRNMINTGLGRFGLKQKVPMPHDHDRVILFYIGGLSTADVRAVNQAMESRRSDSPGQMSFLCGGTTLLSPPDTLGNYFMS